MQELDSIHIEEDNILPRDAFEHVKRISRQRTFSSLATLQAFKTPQNREGCSSFRSNVWIGITNSIAAHDRDRDTQREREEQEEQEEEAEEEQEEDVINKLSQSLLREGFLFTRDLL